MTNDNSANNPVPNFYRASAADFKKIPGSPIAYSASKNMINAFYNYHSLSQVSEKRLGLCTGNNNQFIRYWYEINFSEIGFGMKSCRDFLETGLRYAPHNKGGESRKWSGNQEFVLKFDRENYEILSKSCNKLASKSHYFIECVTWSEIGDKFAVRILPYGFVFNIKGPSIFSGVADLYLLGAYLNSIVFGELLSVISQTMSFNGGEVEKVPFPNLSKTNKSLVREKAIACLNIANRNYYSYEPSWDFTSPPPLQPEYHQPTIRETYTKLRAHWQEMTLEMQRLEEENNHIFIEAYGLQDELMPEVPLSEITLTCNPHYRYRGDKSEKELEALLLTDTIKEFISYSVGCMFGRYSLDKPGLILANHGETIDDYLQQVPEPSFMPDDDNIIPILDDEYFTDDIVGRFKEFLKATFGAESLAENLEFIAGALSKSKKGSASPEKVIRDYFLKSFFKDHVKTYKKRPIYWLFTSGKGRGFNALVYMHRYNRETLAKMGTDYLLELEAKLDARIRMLGDEAGAEKGRLGAQIEELMDYDAVLHNKSLEYIDIDLDDGVKVNYAKFEGLVGKI